MAERYEGDLRVSLVVTVPRPVAALLDCLDSVHRHTPRDLGVEVIVASRTDDVPDLADVQRRVPWSRLVVADRCVGTAGLYNRAARETGGRYLALLAGDAVVEPGWLAALLEVAEADPEVGLVGGTVLDPGGRLLEAGGILWSDGSTAAIGPELPGGEKPHAFVREVDYCSATSLLVRRDLWDQLGGMDEDYHPAPIADVDLCLAVATQGFRVVCQPRSRVRTTRTPALPDPRYGELVLRRGRRRLQERWAAALARREPPPTPEARPAAVDRAVRRARALTHRLLLIDDRFPDPGLGSGMPRMLGVAEELSRLGALSFFPTAGWSGDTGRLTRLGAEIVNEPLETHLARAQVLYDAVVISRPHNYERFGELVHRHQPQAVVVYDAEALFHRRMFLQAEVTGDAQVAAAAARMRELELRIAGDVDHVVCVSEDEAMVLAAVDGHAPISVMPPRGIAGGLTPAGFAERRDLLLATAWLHTGPDSPNLDGLLWFAAEVLPRVCAVLPWARLLVTGGAPPPPACALAGPNLRLLGHVEDLGAAYAAARVVVVPMRFGSGVKNKTVEALLHGVPTVATSVGAEGLGDLPAGALAVADEPQAIADSIVRLLTDPDAWLVQRLRIESLLREWAAATRPSWHGIIRGLWDQRGERGASCG